ncbi:uncharacterized protein BBOV_IV010000 [Babesia bovis T2Bo]|uniref:Membrane protein, putative n=1 Tax=Babesia bovis TaxID=5865 RepID=A7AS35_BABBO|nr:uncharacterized protein BBOV_IV010000 [Babesia bovis T2Bo]EDO07354.1 putative integral membrane protein [Babesia bovis T2Bo]BAN65827.1 membrane protein, putative [Babesia bovis]|eukprot:XP_001610922.1 hypothetical protein [Babesia bovis T2Bo]
MAFKFSVKSALAAVLCALFSLKIVKAINVNIVLDGAVYERSVTGDLCSVIAAADSAIVKSTLPFSSIDVIPEHWVLYINGVSLPVTQCEANDALLQPLGLKDNDFIYLFRSEYAYQDPIYAAEYVKTFSKSFGDRIKPPKKSAEATKKLSKKRAESKKSKNVSDDSKELVALISVLAKTFLSNTLSSAFAMDKPSSSTAVKSSEVTTPEIADKPEGWNVDMLADIVSSLSTVQATPAQSDVKPIVKDDL